MHLFLQLAIISLLAIPGIRLLAQNPAAILVEDFETYRAGEAPYLWKWPHKQARKLLNVDPIPTSEIDFFSIVEENGRKYARAFTKDETIQIARENGDGYQWDLQTHPQLSWQWRAIQLPEGAREDKRSLNDTGGAVYVLFDCPDWLNRPCSIKYTYSSTLPVGSTARYGNLRVLVVASGQDGIGDWLHMKRNVVDDYQQLYGKKPPGNPEMILLWGDSDTTHGVSDVLFDTVELLPANS